MEKSGFASSLLGGMEGLHHHLQAWEAQYPTLKSFPSLDMKIGETCLVVTGRI